MFQIIIKDKSGQLGRTRSEHEANLRKEWGTTMSDEDYDKCKYMERRAKDIDGSAQSFIPGHVASVADKLPNTFSENWNTGKGVESLYARNYENIKWDK